MGLAHVRTLIALAVLVAAGGDAHEIGTTNVNALFSRDHTYLIDVETSHESLQRRHATVAMILAATEIRFGETRVTPRLTWNAGYQPAGPPATSRQVAGEPAARLAAFRLEGDIPPGARTFTWRYGLSYASYALTECNEADPPQTQWISGDDASKPFALAREVVPPSRLDVVRQYLTLGFTHIVPYGLDHILFVLGIFLLSMKVKPILTQVTAFTIAHSITLGLTMYGVVSVSPRIVEPMIALSIAYIAIENLTTSKLRPWRVALVFAFGLLHGMGFAGVLKELGLPRSEFLTALVTFNAGVELGQLSVILAAFLLVGWWGTRRFLVPASATIAATGIFWTIQRIASS